MLDKAKNKGEPTTYLRNVNVRWGAFDLTDLAQMRMTPEERSAFGIRDGDLLVCEGGEPGRAAVWRDGPTTITYQKALMRLRSAGVVEPDLLQAFLRHLAGSGALSEHFTGTTIKHLPQNVLRQVQLPIPPLAEQRRIVAKLDALTTRTARARADLDRILALAARYKRALLADAFSGRLGRAAAGARDWGVERASEVCAKVQSGGTPKAGFRTEGVPFLKVYNVVGQRVDFKYRPQFVSAEAHSGELKKSVAYPGDVVMNIVGPPLGKVAIVPSDYDEWNLNQALTLFRPSSRITTKWLYYFLCGGDSIQSVINETRGSAGQVNISLSQCRSFMIPVPPLEEQSRIVALLERTLGEIERLTAEAASARRLLDCLDQAVLAKAFQGELVAQDPADEPASALLDRIRADRASAPKATRGPRKAVA